VRATIRTDSNTVRMATAKTASRDYVLPKCLQPTDARPALRKVSAVLSELRYWAGIEAALIGGNEEVARRRTMSNDRSAAGSSWYMSAMSIGGITAGDFSRRNKRLPVVLQVRGRGMAVPFVPIGVHLLSRLGRLKIEITAHRVTGAWWVFG
jgi:hypothetical protein